MPYYPQEAYENTQKNAQASNNSNGTQNILSLLNNNNSENILSSLNSSNSANPLASILANKGLNNNFLANSNNEALSNLMPLLTSFQQKKAVPPKVAPQEKPLKEYVKVSDFYSQDLMGD